MFDKILQVNNESPLNSTEREFWFSFEREQCENIHLKERSYCDRLTFYQFPQQTLI